MPTDPQSSHPAAAPPSLLRFFQIGFRLLRSDSFFRVETPSQNEESFTFTLVLTQPTAWGILLGSNNNRLDDILQQVFLPLAEVCVVS